jgi:hypothetical protein
MNKDANVVVAHIQALIKRRSRKQERDVASVYPLMEGWVPDLVIVDEGHHKPADSWELIWNEAKRKNPNVKLLALTATPQRGDGKRFGLKSVDQFYLYERWCVVTVYFPFSRHSSIPLTDLWTVPHFGAADFRAACTAQCGPGTVTTSHRIAT